MPITLPNPDQFQPAPDPAPAAAPTMEQEIVKTVRDAVPTIYSTLLQDRFQNPGQFGDRLLGKLKTEAAGLVTALEQKYTVREMLEAVIAEKLAADLRPYHRKAKAEGFDRDVDGVLRRFNL